LFSSRFRNQFAFRLTTQIVSLILVWLGTGGVLKHTDDLSAFRSFPFAAHRAASVERGVVLAPAGDDDCAACRWATTSSDMLVAPPFRTTQSLSFFAESQPLPVSASTSQILHAYLRAPPVQALSAA